MSYYCLRKLKRNVQGGASDILNCSVDTGESVTVRQLMTTTTTQTHFLIISIKYTI